MTIFKRIFPDWLETRHVVLAVHTAVGFGFFGLATAYYTSGAVTQAAFRALVGVGALALGAYIYRANE